MLLNMFFLKVLYTDNGRWFCLGLVSGLYIPCKTSLEMFPPLLSERVCNFLFSP